MSNVLKVLSALFLCQILFVVIFLYLFWFRILAQQQPCCTISDGAGAIIGTEYGFVKGTKATSRNGSEFLAFYGIPYASPPVGRLRLKPPVEPQPWDGVKDATQLPPKCIQSYTYKKKLIGQEDCLYLNVFTHESTLGNETAKYPVMVYIHGGGFMAGYSAKNGANFFADKPVVLVTFNYRLGALGNVRTTCHRFLGMGVNEFSGNFGLKDQVFALKWVKNNIEAFGGNPNEVTLFGISAGAASVHLQAFNPLVKGLYHQSIMQSGSAFTTWSVSTRKNGRIMTTALAVATACYRNEEKNMLDCLQELDVFDFVVAERKLLAWEDEPSPLFIPMVEGEEVIEAALPKIPHEKNYHTKDIPWITGIVSAEGCFKVDRYLQNEGKMIKQINENYRRLIPLITHFTYVSDHPDNLTNIADNIKEYYFGKEEISMETDLKLVDMLSDALFIYPLMNTILSHRQKTYVYLFDHKSIYDGKLGVCHAAEERLLFCINGSNDLTPDDTRTSKLLIDFWTNFAIHGNPNGNNIQQIWIPVRLHTSEIHYLHITNNTVMEEGLYPKRYSFWKSLPLGVNWITSV